MSRADQHEYSRWSHHGSIGGMPRPSIAARLYCLPHAGGTARVFHRWRKLLRSDIEICPLDYPGHGSRLCEPLLGTIDQIARSAADQLMQDLDVPYALFGHSMGSLVAFETCRVLAARGAAMPSLLIASGHNAPRVARMAQPIHNSPKDTFIAHLRTLGATPPEVFDTPDLLELMLPILRNDFRACETYSPAEPAPLPVPIAVYGGLADKDTNREALFAWQRETSGPCVVRMFPGGHFFINERADHVVSTLERDLIGALASERLTPCPAY
jgi:medium-chain acyl-[acyl-carrier-protein] hydrolase